MYGECEGSQNKKIVMVSIRKGPWERRHGTKRSDKEKSATQEENRNTYHDLHTDLYVTLYIVALVTQCYLSCLQTYVKFH